MWSEPPPAELDKLVGDALANAWREQGLDLDLPALAASTGASVAANHSRAPDWLGAVGTSDDPLRAMTLTSTTVPKASTGDQAAIERIGRATSRRDPVSALNPLPAARDSSAFSSAAISAGAEPGQHWPDLVAYRSSDSFPVIEGATPVAGGNASSVGGSAVPPAVAYAPIWATNRVDHIVPGAVFPAAAPSGLPRLGDAPARALGALAAASGPAASEYDVPAWLADVRLDPAALRPADVESTPGVEAVPAGQLPGPQGSPAVSGSPVDSEHPLGPIRADFPALHQRVNGHPLVWLDNGATTQKPREVLDTVRDFYEHDNSNVHRGAHDLAVRATDVYERARQTVQAFIGARSEKEIVFLRGTTEAINLVAQAWGSHHVGHDDEILVSHLEHHSNIVPWQQLCEAKGAKLRVIPVDDSGNVKLSDYAAMLSPRVKLVAVTQISNALGTLVPIGPMATMAHAQGAHFLVDAAQSIAHLPLDVQSLGIDFLAFSGHKIYAPTGIGVLYGREEVLRDTPPWQGGGSMISDVTFERTVYADLPARFEAGTPNLGGAVGLAAALRYVERIGRPAVAAYEHGLMQQLEAGLATVPGLEVVGDPMVRVGSISFTIAGATPNEIAHYLNKHGIAVRAGHHCAQPILRRFGHETTVRPSLGIYNTPADIERLVAVLQARPAAGVRG